MQQITKNFLGLDYGQARVGVALAHAVARLPQPFGALDTNSELVENIRELCVHHDIDTIVVGLPRDMNGNETAQTALVREFIAQLHASLALPLQIVEQDEAVTSKQAEAELRSRKVAYTKADIDALSATYILEDYLREN